jgi:hypothetical protein
MFSVVGADGNEIIAIGAVIPIPASGRLNSVFVFVEGHRVG